LVDEPWTKLISYGGFGVHMFVILSGFGLNLSSSLISTKDFYRRRFLKILIPYYLFICFVFICNQFIQVYPGDGLYAFLGHIFFYKMFDENIITSFGHYLWFVSMILQLYITYPFLVKLNNHFGNHRFFLCVLVISLFWLSLIVFLKIENMRIVNSCGLSFLWEFGLGMVLGNLFRDEKFIFWEVKKTFPLLTCIILGGLMAGIFSAKGGNLGSTKLNVFPAALSFTSLAIYSYSICSNRILVWFRKCIIFVGNISYEVYLIHGFLATMALRFLFCAYNNNLIVALNFLIVLPVAIFSAFIFSILNKTLYRLLS
jgi:peptidoglycan/LPS O-acetylase OafA/YrhL